MPVIQELVNFDLMFSQLKTPPIIVNDLVNSSEEQKAANRELIMTRYTTDMLSTLPRCRCGGSEGEHRIGEMCPECNTPVQSVVEEDIEPVVWFRKPEGVHKLINPEIWTMLRNKFTRSGFSIMNWLCDTTYRPTVKEPPVLADVKALNLPRGWNAFVENYDMIVDALFSLKAFKLKSTQIDYLYPLLKMNKELVFCDYLPLPNKALLIIEKTNVGVYIDTTIIEAVDAIEMIMAIDSEFSEHSLRVKENRAIKCINKLANFYESYNKNNIASKKGMWRKHVFGSRTHFSFRSVISSLTGDHRYNEIHAPWCVGVTVLRPHLMNKLSKRGYDHNQAIGFLNAHVEKYHPLIDELLNEIISESPLVETELGNHFHGIPTISQRNPSLLRGSAQLTYITKFKTDPTDHTTSISILICKAFNADFDGDALNFSLGIDNKMAKLWYGLSPHKNVFELTVPGKVSDNISMPKPVIATISNFLSSERGYEFTPEQEARFNAIPVI